MLDLDVYRRACRLQPRQDVCSRTTRIIEFANGASDTPGSFARSCPPQNSPANRIGRVFFRQTSVSSIRVISGFRAAARKSLEFRVSPARCYRYTAAFSASDSRHTQPSRFVLISFQVDGDVGGRLVDVTAISRQLPPLPGANIFSLSPRHVVSPAEDIKVTVVFVPKRIQCQSLSEAHFHRAALRLKTSARPRESMVEDATMIPRA